MHLRDDLSGEVLGHVFIPLLNYGVRERSYGATVERIEFSVARLDGTTRPDPAFVRSLPRARFSRKTRVARVCLLTRVPLRDLTHARPGQEPVIPYPFIEFLAPHFDALAVEFLDALGTLRRALKRADDLQLDALLEDLHAFARDRPRDPGDFRALALRAIGYATACDQSAARIEAAAVAAAKPTMTEDDFWMIIEGLRGGRDAKLLPRAMRALARWPERDIIEFEEILARKLYEIDTEAHACRGKAGPFEGSGDGFLYDRCAVVVQGRVFYERVRSDPSAMPAEDEAELDEELLHLAPDAYEAKTDARLVHSTRVSYETGCNGKGWPSS
ncbi:MAG: DUF4240 domain-containing protein [Polyangiaceae bacterium]|nr:DUF4240 domain-containing protein [Polyangiaceae bacterium]